MAALALIAKATVVNIVIGMTAGAAARQADFAFAGPLVAGVAIQPLVRAVQLEVRALVVVEAPRLPVVGVVTIAAIRSELELVLVILLVAGDALHLGVPEGRREVAFFALHLGVFAEQREACQTVVEARHLPVFLVVAGLALLALLALVLVVLLVAVKAIGAQLFLVHKATVAGCALGGDVLAAQRVFGHAVVIENGFLPVLLDVAGFALVAELALVASFVVILAMARHAEGRGFFLVQDAGMTRRALGRAVFALEGVLGVAVVVEAQRLPVAVGVTGLALVAELALVTLFVVILAVAGHALQGRTLEFWIGVAIIALHVAVLAGERKFCLAMVERGVLPVFLAVAVGAGLAERALCLSSFW